MKWDNTMQWIDSSTELLMIAMKYCGRIYDNNGTALKRVQTVTTICDEDRQTADENLCKIEPRSVAQELESHLTCNSKHDERVYDVWAEKIQTRLKPLCVFENFLKSDRQCYETWIKIGGWEQYIKATEDTNEFVWLIAVCLYNKFVALQYEISSIIKSYGLEKDAGFIALTMRKDVPMSVESKESPYSTFSNIIQYPDKEKLLLRLHELIDGRAGADVGCVILRAYQENYLIRFPKQKEFESEFDLIGTWSAIHNYLNDGDPRALNRSNRIVIFD